MQGEGCLCVLLLVVCTRQRLVHMVINNSKHLATCQGIILRVVATRHVSPRPKHLTTWQGMYHAMTQSHGARRLAVLSRCQSART